MPRIHWRNQFKQLSNQSNAHEHIRSLFTDNEPFSHLHCYQEVPVVDICPNYKSNQHRFDWFISELGLVIEIHGEQHYKPTAWAKGVSYTEKMVAFAELRTRDSMKKNAAIDSGYQYVELPYDMAIKMTAEGLRTILNEVSNQ